jgi:hypothetical protein
MAEPKKFAIIVADIKDDKITNAQYKITEEKTEKPDTTGYYTINITDLSTPSATTPVTGEPPILPEPTNSKSENTWPKELEPTTYESIQKNGIFYLVKTGKDEASEEGKKITTLELLKKLSPDLTPTPKKDYKVGIEKLLFRKINIVKVQKSYSQVTTDVLKAPYRAITRANQIPKEIQVDFTIPGKIDRKAYMTVLTDGTFISKLTAELKGIDKNLDGKYVIYQPVGNEDLLSISRLAEEDEDKDYINEAVTSLSPLSGGAKKQSKKNNLKTKNRRKIRKISKMIMLETLKNLIIWTKKLRREFSK